MAFQFFYIYIIIGGFFVLISITIAVIRCYCIKKVIERDNERRRQNVYPMVATGNGNAHPPPVAPGYTSNQVGPQSGLSGNYNTRGMYGAYYGPGGMNGNPNGIGGPGQTTGNGNADVPPPPTYTAATGNSGLPAVDS